MKSLFLTFLLVAATSVRGAEAESLTLRLTRVFDTLWERSDTAGMYAFLDPECIYKTPFRTEIGRDAVRDHVFPNFSKFRENVSTEEFSKVEENFAYSIGVTTFNEYDKDGKFKVKWASRYVHIFTRRPGEDWKMRFHIVHEDAARPISTAEKKKD